MNTKRNNCILYSDVSFSRNNTLSTIYRDGEAESNYREHSEQKSNSDGENFINPASFL